MKSASSTLSVHPFGCPERFLSGSLILVLAGLILLSGCQAPGPRVSDGGGQWPGLLAEDAVMRTQTIHLIQKSGDRSHAPLLFPMLNDEDRWVRYNARAAILILAGPHHESAPVYRYMAGSSALKAAPEAHRIWWESLFPGSTG
jgi:hypothetical protein